MEIKKYIVKGYPRVGPFEGINSVESRLLKHRYLVVIDNDDKFYGILTPSDIIERPHKIVIDCITKKDSLAIDGTIANIIDKFYSNRSYVLPVLSGSDFVGVVEKDQISRALEYKVNELYDKSLISKKAKEFFLSNLSHEIRTPLNGIIGFLNIISDLKINDFDHEKENISDIVRKLSDHFLRTMEDLVELSLLFAGDEIKIKKAEVDVVEILRELRSLFDELSALHKIEATIIYSDSESCFNVYTDGKRLKHILFHLIDNAIKFSKDNKVIYGFNSELDKNNIRFFVKNESSQILQQDRVKIFELFEKQEIIGSKLNSGLGIGLPLVKSLTQLLGGTVGVDFDGDDVIFSINIPIVSEVTNKPLEERCL